MSYPSDWLKDSNPGLISLISFLDPVLMSSEWEFLTSQWMASMWMSFSNSCHYGPIGRFNPTIMLVTVGFESLSNQIK